MLLDKAIYGYVAFNFDYFNIISINIVNRGDNEIIGYCRQYYHNNN